MTDRMREMSDLQSAMPERECRLHDALKQLVGWVEEGCHDDGRQYVLTEARAALKDMRLVPVIE